MIILLSALSAGWFFPESAGAQQIPLGGGKMQFSDDQKLMFEAAGKVVHHDYKGAEALYNQAIAANSGNVDAYLQRGIVRRELGDEAGTASDGQMAVRLADGALKNNPNDPNLYYKRGMGFRLLKNYDQAQKDISAGMNMGGPSVWQTDLQAIALEQKAAR